MLKCSIGICAYNEEKNIGRLIEALLRQELAEVAITEVIAIISGCTDRTGEIVKGYVNMDGRVKLVEQEKREGKASAVNLFIKNAKEDILVLTSADVIPRRKTIEHLVRPFEDGDIGMVGAHPIPVNDPNTFLGFVEHVRWEATHQLAERIPRLGEMVAFRKVFDSIPSDSAVDEACIEGLVISRGYRLHYAGDAVVYNKGSETVSDFIKQRRRCLAGHCYLRHTYEYTVSSMNFVVTFSLFLKTMKTFLRDFFWTWGAIFLEGYARMFGYYDYYIKHKNPYIWEISETTKDLGHNDIDNI